MTQARLFICVALLGCECKTHLVSCITSSFSVDYSSLNMKVKKMVVLLFELELDRLIVWIQNLLQYSFLTTHNAICCRVIRADRKPGQRVRRRWAETKRSPDLRSERSPDLRGALIWEEPWSENTLIWEYPDLRGAWSERSPDLRGALIWEEPDLRGAWSERSLIWENTPQIIILGHYLELQMYATIITTLLFDLTNTTAL